MRKQPPPDKDSVENWRVLRHLLPYLSEYKGRVILALAFMICAKLANTALPFVIKGLVDQFSGEAVTGINTWLLAPIALVLIYGLLRFANVLFAEIRDTLFVRVTERAMRRIGHRVFIHLHNLDIDYHLNRNTGGLSRDIERGVGGISFIMRFMIFSILPALIEIMLVLVILFSKYGITFAVTTLTSIVVYITFSVKVTEWRKRFLRATNKADSDSNSRAIDSLLNYETVKYYTNENFEANRYDKNLMQLENAK